MRRWLCVVALLVACTDEPTGTPQDVGGPTPGDAAVDSGTAAPLDSGATPAPDAAPVVDAGHQDSGSTAADAGELDAAPTDTGPVDSGVDSGVGADASVVDAGAASCPEPANLTRAERWIRSNEMFVSGLVPGLGIPTLAHVNDYYDTFGANAAHFWQDSLPNLVNGWSAHNHPKHRFVSWTLNNGGSGGQMGTLGGFPPNAPGRIGYQIGDEPVTMAELTEVLEGARNVRAYDPTALIILNFTVTRATDIDAQLLAAGNEPAIDVFSYDRYTYNQVHYDSLSLIREAAQRHGKAYWRYLDTLHGPGDPDPLSVSNLRWDAFVGLLYGFTGHTWFIYQVGAPHTVDLRFGPLYAAGLVRCTPGTRV